MASLFGGGSARFRIPSPDATCKVDDNFMAGNPVLPLKQNPNSNRDWLTSSGVDRRRFRTRMRLTGYLTDISHPWVVRKILSS
jgi:hypothetical protein